MRKVLEKISPLKMNITKEEISLQRDKNIIVLVNKENAIVILDKKLYEKKLNDLIDSEKVNKDLILSKLSLILNKDFFISKKYE